MRFTIGLRWKAVKSLAVSNPSLSPEDWGFLLTMIKRTHFFRLETFFLASLGVHLLFFLTLSIFSDDTAKSLISPSRLEVHLLSIASPAIAEEKSLPKPVSPFFQRKVQPPPLKIQHLESAPIEELETRFHTASSDVPENENKRIPFVREEEKPREESPAKKETVERTDSGLPKDEEPLWIQTAAPSKEFSSSALVISPPQEGKLPAHSVELPGNDSSFSIVPLDPADKAGLAGHSPVKSSSWGGGMQEEKIQVAKGVSLFERETSFVHPRYLNNPKPIYPQEAKQRGYQGEVTLRVEVLGSGQVGQIEIRRSSGYEILDRSALATVKQWQFVPAKRGKESIPLWVNIPIKFRIE
jgi:TonB family protein